MDKEKENNKIKEGLDTKKKEIAKEKIAKSIVIEKDLKKKEADSKEKNTKEKSAKINEFRTITPTRQRREARPEVKKEFEEKVLEIKRVVRVVKGGRRFKFRAAVVVGNHNGKVGIGLGKGQEVVSAINKAVARAKKNIIEVKRKGTTIPFDIENEFKTAKILLKPAKKGTGIIAGGPVRIVVELAGITDISSKMLGSKNKVNNMTSTLEALKRISSFKEKK